MSTQTEYVLRFPKSLGRSVEKLSKEEGITPSEFTMIAVAEKVAALRTESLIRSDHGDWDGIHRVQGSGERRGKPMQVADFRKSESTGDPSSERYDATVRMQASDRDELALYFPHEMAADAGWENAEEVAISFSDHQGERWIGRVTTKSSHLPYMRTNVFSHEDSRKCRLSDLLHRSGLQAKDRVPCTFMDDGTVILHVSQVKHRDHGASD